MTFCQRQWCDSDDVEHFCTLALGHEGKHYDGDDECWMPDDQGESE